MNRLHIFLISMLALLSQVSYANVGVRLKDMARIDAGHESALVGYGIVVGLAGSGDSARNRATLQSLANTLANFGVRVTEEDLNARNTAAVMVTATLSPFAEIGDRVDVQVASIGDAKSLAGGTLILAPLYGPDQLLYALSQGPLAVGGYKVESFADSVQKNYPTVGRIPRGATVERAPKRTELTANATAETDATSESATSSETKKSPITIGVVLNQPDYTTAQRLVRTVRAALGVNAKTIHPGKVEVTLAPDVDVMELVARLEALSITPDQNARVVINERTGTIVAGSNVQIGEVSIAQGELQIVITTEFLVSQPNLIGRDLPGVSTEVVPDTEITVKEQNDQLVQLQNGTTVGDLVRALQRIKLSTRDIISILQSIKTAGALHAELVIQ